MNNPNNTLAYKQFVLDEIAKIEGAGEAPSVQSDWNQNDPTKPDYIKNRTHYEEGSGGVIEWDGLTESLENVDSVDINGHVFYKISDLTPSKEELVGSVWTVNENTMVMPEEQISEMFVTSNKNVMYGGDGLAVIYDTTFESYDETCVAPSVGTYVDPVGWFAFSITYGSTTIHTLDEKFIPDTIARTSDIPESFSGSWNDLTDKPFETGSTIIEWDGSTENRDTFEFNGVVYYKLSDVLPTPDEVIGGIVESNAGDVDTIDTNLIVIGENGFAVSSIMFVQSEIFTVANISATAPSIGCYGAITPIGYVTKLTYESVKTLDEKFIPDGIARVEDIVAPKTELILKSSIEGSTKKFKLTIDDNGVLTATEIVESAT